MNHQFSLKIDPILGTAQVLLNRQPLYAQSQLQVCATQSFFEWYTDLPNLMFSEVNDNYSVTVECVDLQYRLLRAVFSQVSECREIRHVPVSLQYNVETRFSWLTEAAAKNKVTLPEVPQFSIRTVGAGTQGFAAVKSMLPAFYQTYCVSSACQVNIWITRDTSLGALPQAQISPNDAVICLESGKTHTQMGQVPVFYEPGAGCSDLIVKWVDQMILMPYLVYCQERLLQQQRSSSFDVVSRVRMLTRDVPCVQLRVPARMECGTSAAFSLEEFPKSTLSLRIGDQNVLQYQGGKLIAGKQGKTTLAVLSQNGRVLQEETVEVYFVVRVTSITLKSDKGAGILLGDTFTIRADCHPANAVNTSKAVWSVTPTNVLQNLGGGRFTALQPGTCSVRLTVEKVSRDIQLTVLPAPTDIQLPQEIRCKSNAAPQRISAQLVPSGSACRTIRCKMGDNRIARWDAANKSVVPVAEGVTTFEVTVVDPTGKALFTRRCPVTILPEKDIVTPPALLTLAICCAILALLTGHSSYGYIFVMGCFFLCGLSFLVNLISWIRGRAGRSQKIQTFVSLIGWLLTFLLMNI